MTDFPTYDPTSDTIRLNGGAGFLLTLLMKAKFGERFDPETLFHPELSGLIEALQRAVGLPKPFAGDSFERPDLFTIAERIFARSAHLGWWSLSNGERRSFLQGVAAPWKLSEEQLQTIIEDVEDLLFRHRLLMAAADAAVEVRDRS